MFPGAWMVHAVQGWGRDSLTSFSAVCLCQGRVDWMCEDTGVTLSYRVGLTRRWGLIRHCWWPFHCSWFGVCGWREITSYSTIKLVLLLSLLALFVFFWMPTLTTLDLPDRGRFWMWRWTNQCLGVFLMEWHRTMFVGVGHFYSCQRHISLNW